MDIDSITAILGALGGGGGIWVGLKLFHDWRVGRAQRASETAEQAAARADSREETVFTRMERAMARLDLDVTRMSGDLERERDHSAEQDRRIDELETANREIAAENRTFRSVILGVMERLRRKPPDTPESILDYILQHLPSLRKEDQ